MLYVLSFSFWIFHMDNCEKVSKHTDNLIDRWHSTNLHGTLQPIFALLNFSHFSQGVWMECLKHVNNLIKQRHTLNLYVFKRYILAGPSSDTTVHSLQLCLRAKSNQDGTVTSTGWQEIRQQPQHHWPVWLSNYYLTQATLIDDCSLVFWWDKMFHGFHIVHTRPIFW